MPIRPTIILCFLLEACNAGVSISDQAAQRPAAKAPEATTDVAAASESESAPSPAAPSTTTRTAAAASAGKFTAANCVDPDLTLLAVGHSLTLCNGTVGQGTLATCKTDGQTTCISDGTSFKAAKIAGFTDGDVRTGVTIAGVAGALSDAPESCSADGAVGCLTTAGHKAAETAGLADKVVSGESVAGITGNVELPAPADVKAAVAYGSSGTVLTGTFAPDFPAPAQVRSIDTVNGVAGTLADCGPGASHCFIPAYAATTQPLKAISFDSITAGVLKKNAVVAGVTGDYPSATYHLAGATTTADLTATSFDARLKDGVTNFEWFDADGSHYSRTGDGNITAANIKDGVDIFGSTGSLAGIAASDAWNLRAGVSFGAVTGKLKVNCRNGGDTATFGIGPIKRAVVANVANTFTVAAHGYSTGDAVQVAYTTAPGGLLGWLYFVVKVDNDTFKLAANPAEAAAGTAIDLTDDGAGVVVWYEGTPRAVTVQNAGNTLTLTGHGFSRGQALRIAARTDPSGLVSGFFYYAIIVSANKIKLAYSASDAVAGTFADILDNGSNVYVYSTSTGALTATDTIDDYNNGGAYITAHPWTSDDNFCGGIEATADDGNVWKDVTTNGANAASTCAATPANCTMQDKISGLAWSKTQSTSATWLQAVTLCSGLNFNNQTTGWRLPTQKEFMTASTHGLRGAASANWITPATMDSAFYWSSSTVSSNAGGFAWRVVPSDGTTSAGTKSTAYQVTCIR